MKPLLDKYDDGIVDINIRTAFASGLLHPVIRDRYKAVADVANEQTTQYFPALACEAYGGLVRLSQAMIPNLWVFTVAVYQALVEALDCTPSRTEQFFRDYDIFKNIGRRRSTYFPTPEAVKLHLFVRDQIGLPNNATFLYRPRPQGGNFPLCRVAQKLRVVLPRLSRRASSRPSALVIMEAVKGLEQWYKTGGLTYDTPEAVRRALAYRTEAGFLNTPVSLRRSVDAHGDDQLYRSALHFNIPLPSSKANGSGTRPPLFNHALPE